MKTIEKSLVAVFIIAFLMLIGVVLASRFAYADESSNIEVQVVTLELAPTPTPSPAMPAPTPAPIEIKNYDLNDKDVDWLARLAFLSPLTAKENKAALMWLVLNRVDSDAFPSTIRQVIAQKSEFGFWSEDKFIKPENLAVNRELARLVMNQWLSEKDGLNAGRLIPKEALFLRFSGEGNRNIELLPDRWGEPLYWPVKGAYEY